MYVSSFLLCNVLICTVLQYQVLYITEFRPRRHATTHDPPCLSLLTTRLAYLYHPIPLNSSSKKPLLLTVSKHTLFQHSRSIEPLFGHQHYQTQQWQHQPAKRLLFLESPSTSVKLPTVKATATMPQRNRFEQQPKLASRSTV